MKKFFLFIYLTCIAAYFGYSQLSLSLSDSTGQIPNNSTIVKTGTPSEDEILTYLFVKNNSADSMPVLVKKVIIDTVPGTINMICWGLCFAPNVYVSPNPKYIKPGRTDSLDFSGHYVPNSQIGVSHIRYVFFNRDNTSDSVCVTVAYSAFPLTAGPSPDKPLLSNAYPNPASDRTTLNYSLPSGSSGTITVRNLLGNVVKELGINPGSGKISINTNDLPDGVYFYTITAAGNSDISRKLIIRH